MPAGGVTTRAPPRSRGTHGAHPFPFLTARHIARRAPPRLPGTAAAAPGTPSPPASPRLACPRPRPLLRTRPHGPHRTRPARPRRRAGRVRLPRGPSGCGRSTLLWIAPARGHRPRARRGARTPTHGRALARRPGPAGPNLPQRDPDAGVTFLRSYIRTVNTSFRGDYKADGAFVAEPAKLLKVLKVDAGTLTAVPSLRMRRDQEMREGTADRLQRAYRDAGSPRDRRPRRTGSWTAPSTRRRSATGRDRHRTREAPHT